MTCAEIPCRLFTLTASNGDPLMLFGEDEAGNVFLWPTKHIRSHAFAFARWTLRNVARWRGKRVTFQHVIDEPTCRWLKFLKVNFDAREAIV